MCPCPPYVYNASTAITSPHQVDEDYLENAKQMDQQDQENPERQDSWNERSENTEVERTEAGWNDMVGWGVKEKRNQRKKESVNGMEKWVKVAQPRGEKDRNWRRKQEQK